MGFWLVVVVTVLYAGAALSFTWERRYALAVMYYGYAFANIGCLILAARPA